MLEIIEIEDKSWRTAQIPKKSGGFRTLQIPCDQLKEAQRKILQYLYTVKPLKPSWFAHGFVPFRNTSSNAGMHFRKSEAIICMDAKDFFDNLPKGPVEKQLFLAGLSIDEVDFIINTCTYRGHFPQGAPTSPCLTNIGMKECDLMLSAFAERHGFTYSRYADDLTFALKDPEESLLAVKHKSYRRFIEGVRIIMRKSVGLEIKDQKTHVIHLNGSEARRVTGVVIRKDGKGYNAPYRMRRTARAMLHNLYCEVVFNHKPAQEYIATWRKLKGYVTYSNTLRRYSNGEVAGPDPYINQEKYKTLEGRFTGLK